MFLSAIKAMASNTVAAGSIDQTVEPFFARIPLIVPAIFMLYLRPGGGRIQKQSWGLVNHSRRKEGARTIANRRGYRRRPDGKRVRLCATPDEVKKNNAWYRETLGDLLKMLSAGTIPPVIGARVQIIEARRAHQLV